MIRYAITPSLGSLGVDVEGYLSRLPLKPDWILYRDLDDPNYKANLTRFVQAAKRYGIAKVLAHNDIDAATASQADGIHLRGDNLASAKRAKEQGLFVLYSAHSLEEIKAAEREGVDAVTLSPVFEVEGKGAPLGVERFGRIVSQVSVPVIALGGIIDDAHIAKVSESGAYGFASIRYFYTHASAKP